MYFWVRESWLMPETVVDGPRVGEGVSFKKGTPIQVDVANPLVFETTYGPGTQPHHYFDYATAIPVVSSVFVRALRAAGLDNFQLFPAVLRNSTAGVEWADYSAFNVLGMVDATDLSQCRFDEVMAGNEGGVPSFGIMRALALKRDRLRDLDMFREPHAGCLVVSKRALDDILACKPEGGFGILAFEVILT
jgi:hypothetical protein